MRVTLLTDKQMQSSDDAVPQLSASALLKQHEKTMKERKVKHLQQSFDAHLDNDKLTSVCSVPAIDNSQCNGSDAVCSSSVKSKSMRDVAVAEPQLSQQHDRPSKLVEEETRQNLKHVGTSQHRVPELGRGVNVGCSGFIDLDDIPCSHSAKVC